MSTHTPESAAERLAGVGNVLVLSPGMASGREALCGALLERNSPRRAVGVLYRGSPGGWVDRHDEAFARGAFAIGVGGSSTGLGVETVDSPDDLTGLEITIQEAVDGEPVGFCLDSLTTLLQYVDGARTVNTLLSFVDAAVWLDEDGTITVERRPTPDE